MNDGSAPRLLVIARRQSPGDWLDGLRAVAQSFAAGTGTLSSGDTGAALETISCDSPGDVEASVDRVRRSLRERRPYSLVALDFLTPHCETVALVNRLWQVQPALFVLGFIEEGEVWNQVASQLERIDQFSFARPSAGLLEIRQAVHSFLQRGALGDKLWLRERELETARSAIQRLQHQAEEGRQAKTQFVANVTHELHTPLNAILGFTGLLLRERLPEDQAEKVCHVRQAGEQLLRIVNGVLDFVNVSSDEAALASAPFQLDPLVRGVLDEAESAAQGKDLTITYHIAEDVPRWLHGDEAHLRQVLLCLVGNAVKFTSRGTVHVQSELDEDSPTTATLRVMVSDTGVGIPPEGQSLVFEPFSQVDGSTTRSYGGLGLGLTLAKQIVDKMGGQIGFRSEQGKGSTFWFVVPLAKHATTEKTPAPAVRTRSARSAPSRVLVVDDDRLARTIAEVLLTRAGCYADLVTNGAEAVSVLKFNYYDLVLMDLQMPKMGGLEAIQVIRNDEKGTSRHVSVVCLSANDSPRDRQRCFEAGADGFLGKPYTAEQFVAALDEFLPRRERTASNSAPPESPNSMGSFREGIRGLRWTLDPPDFPVMESLARELKELAARSGASDVADHAMRIQLAARGRDARRAAAALEQLDRAIHGPSDAAPRPPVVCAGH